VLDRPPLPPELVDTLLREVRNAAGLGAAIGAGAGAATAFLARLVGERKRQRKIAEAAARKAVEEHEESCRLRVLRPALTPPAGTPSPFNPWTE